MNTKQIFYSKRKSGVDYFRPICADAKSMENVTLFYYNNTISGLRKSPEERYPNETEVLHYVFTGISLYNRQKIQEFEDSIIAVGKALTNDKITGSKARVMVCAMYPGDVGTKKRVKPVGCKDDSWKRPSYMKYPTYHNPFLSYEQLDAIFKHTGNPVYKRMPSQVNQNAIRRRLADIRSYYNGKKAHNTNPNDFTGRPNKPKYKKCKESTAWFSNQTAKLKEVNGKYVLSFVNSNVVIPVGKANGKYVKTEAKPVAGGYMILVTFDNGEKEIQVPENALRLMGVDTGVDNFAAVVNNVGTMPFLIKGGAVKSMNQWFNKQRARLISDLTKGKDSTHSEKNSHNLDALTRKRDAFLRDFFYKAAHYICKTANLLHIQVIIAGHNKGQKQEINMGHVNNQSFVSIPFKKFLYVLKNTAWKYGIAFIDREESYTSKASLLDFDDIPTYSKNNKEKYTFSGRRIHRGLYKSKDGTLINADVNGAGNTIRKEYPDAFKGVDMTYLYKTTKVVKYTDLYSSCNPSVVQEKHKVKKEHSHKPSPLSRTTKYYRWDKKIALMQTFDSYKKVYKKVKKAS